MFSLLLGGKLPCKIRLSLTCLMAYSLCSKTKLVSSKNFHYRCFFLLIGTLKMNRNNILAQAT